MGTKFNISLMNQSYLLINLRFQITYLLGLIELIMVRFKELSKIKNCIIDKEKSSYKSITNSSLIICNYLGTIWLELFT